MFDSLRHGPSTRAGSLPQSLTRRFGEDKIRALCGLGPLPMKIVKRRGER